MAKFCTNCGRPLEEGQVCSCTMEQFQQNVAAQQAQQQAAQQPNIQIQFNKEQYEQMKQKSGAYVSSLINAFVNILRYPYSRGRDFVAKIDEKLAFGFIGLQAIISALFALAVVGRINSTINQAAGLAVGSAYSSYVSKTVTVSYAKAFFVTLLISLVISALLSGLVFVGNRILKGNASYKQILCVTSVRSIAVVPFVLLSIVLVFMSPTYAIALFAASEIMAMFYVYLVFPVGSAQSQELLPLVMFVIVLLFVVVSYFIMKNSAGFLVPDMMKEAFDSLNKLDFTDIIGDLY